MYVEVNPNNINTETASIDSTLKDFDAGVNSVKNIVDSIGSIWQGQDYRQFESKMNEFSKELAKFSLSMGTFNEFVKGYVDAGERLDNFYSNEKINLK